MNLRPLVGRRIDIDRLAQDVERRVLRGAHYHKRGSSDQEFDVVEFVVGRDLGYVYALKIFLADDEVRRIRRVKFEAMCGGWRGNDKEVRKFPADVLEEPLAIQLLRSYVAGPLTARGVRKR